MEKLVFVEQGTYQGNLPTSRVLSSTLIQSTFRFFRHLDPLSSSTKIPLRERTIDSSKYPISQTVIFLELPRNSRVRVCFCQVLFERIASVYSFPLILTFQYCSPTPGIKERKRKEERRKKERKEMEKHIFTASCCSLTCKLLTTMMNGGIREARGEKISVELASLIEIKPALLGCSFGVNRLSR